MLYFPADITKKKEAHAFVGTDEHGQQYDEVFELVQLHHFDNRNPPHQHVIFLRGINGKTYSEEVVKQARMDVAKLKKS